MNIIEIDQLKRTGPKQDDPMIQFNRSGKIILNTGAVKSLQVKEGHFIHFYQDQDNIYVKCDFNQENGLKLYYNSKAAQCTVQSKNVVKYLVDLLKTDISAKPAKLPLEDADFGKFKIRV